MSVYSKYRKRIQCFAEEEGITEDLAAQLIILAQTSTILDTLQNMPPLSSRTAEKAFTDEEELPFK